MRNLLYPRQKAAYITEAQLRELKDKNVIIERDYTFGAERAEVEDSSKSPISNGESAIDVQLQLLSVTSFPARVPPPRQKLIDSQPERAMKIISATLPASLVFYRTPIPHSAPDRPPPSEPPRRFPQQYMSTAEMDAAMIPSPVDSQPIAIYGSVSKADIAESIKAVLAETEEGQRVVIGADDVKIVRIEGEEDADSDRLKTLGEHQVEIQVRGGEAVTRTVSIKAQES